MNSKQLKIGTLFLAGVLASVGTSAHADQINTSGSICHFLAAAQAGDFGYTMNAIFNASTANRDVVCPVPYPTFSSLFDTATFSVDGHNDPGTSTTCTVFVLGEDGATIDSDTYSESAPVSPPGNANGRNWEHESSFPNTFLVGFNTVTAVCTIPGNRDARIRGVTAQVP